MALDKSKQMNARQSASSGARQVLVVDDSPAQRNVLRRMLSNQGYHVTEAESGADALEICLCHPPEIVISDWMMPGMDGLEFCHEFRRMTRDNYGYFILLTSKNEKEDVTKGFDAGADDFLTKPINGYDLRARIRAGERVLEMEKELQDKNRLIRSALDELQAMHDSINRDLIEAQKLQNSLVSEKFHDLDAVQITLMLRSCGHVGGDLVGTFPVNKDEVGVYGIDVSGHGISSALMTARLAGYLSATAPSQNIALHRLGGQNYAARCPAETAKRLNDLILGEIQTEHYFTLLLAILNQRTGKVTFTQAGHPKLAIQRAGGTLEMAGRGGLPVGLLKDANYEVCTETLGPGDRLLIYSDGMTECRDPSGALFGEDRLRLSMMRHAAKSRQPFIDAMIDDMTRFCGGEAFDDDISAVLVEIKQDPNIA